MLSLINNSVRSLNKRLTNMVNGYNDPCKLNVNFCKFDCQYLNFFSSSDNDCMTYYMLNDNELLKEYNVLYIVHSDVNLEIFYITDEGDVKCIISEKFNFPLVSVDSMLTGIFEFYPKEMPIISIVSNVNDKILDLENNSEKYFLKFYSLKSKRVIHNLRFKTEIISFTSKPNFFVIGFSDGSLKCCDSKLRNFLTVQTMNTLDIKSQKENLCPSSNSSNVSASSDWKTTVKASKSKEKTPIFDISEDYILYFYESTPKIKEGQVRKKDLELNPSDTILSDLSISNRTQSNKSELSNYYFHPPSSNYYNTIESLAVETYKNLSKLKDWSLNQLNDFSNLRNASKISNNLDFTRDNQGVKQSKSKSSYLMLQKVTLRLLEDENKDEVADDSISNNPFNSNKKFHSENSFKIKVPFFEEGISIVKFLKNSKYFIVGNKYSQMFYIYECFPQSNLKYTKDYDLPGIFNASKNSIFSFKISYSIYRGLTSANINDIDFSDDKKFVVLSSNKGTFHLFNLPKLENQIIENSITSDYTNLNYINQKIVNAIDVDKIKLGSVFSSNSHKSACKLINISTGLNMNNKQIFNSNISSVLFTYIDSISAVQVYLLDNQIGKSINENKNSVLLKSIPISNADSEEIDENLKDLRKKSRNSSMGGNNPLINVVNKMKSQFQDFFDIETTDQNFPKIHSNPLFSMSIYSNETNIKTKSLKNLNIIKENIYDHLESTNNEYKSNTSLLIVDQSHKINEIKIEMTSNLTFPANNNKKHLQNLSMIKSRSNSISQKINNNYSSYNNLHNNHNNTYSNDLIIHEKMLSKNYKYSSFNNYERINYKGRKSDGHFNKYLYHTSNYTLFKNKLKKKGPHKNSSISDSSSLENSISLNNIINTSEILESDGKERHLHVIKQIHKEMETNIAEKLNKNINVVKVVSNFNIDENYYGQK
jgi:hypothetical protein